MQFEEIKFSPNSTYIYPFNFALQLVEVSVQFCGYWVREVPQCWLIIYCQSKEQAVQFISPPLAWLLVDQVDLCPRSFTQQETAPAVQRSGAVVRGQT